MSPSATGMPAAGGVSYLLRSTGPAELTTALEASLVAQWTATPLSSEAVGLSGFYKYPAALRPRAARELLRILPSGTLLDPFCGSGSSLLEALVSGRRAVGNDASPLALFVALHQTLGLDPSEADRLRRAARAVVGDVRAQRKAAFAAAQAASEAAAQVAAAAAARGEPAPPPPRRPRSGRQLQWRALTAGVRQAEAAGAAAGASGQGEVAGAVGPSSPRAGPAPQPTPLWFCLAVAMQRAKHDPAAPPDLFLGAVEAYCAGGAALSRLALPPPVLLHSDARSLDPALLPWGQVDALLTSPPYPGVYDYLSLAREERARLVMRSRGGRNRKTRGVAGGAAAAHAGEEGGHGSGAGEESGFEAGAWQASGDALMGLVSVPAGRAWPGGWSSEAEIGARKARRRKPEQFAEQWQADQEVWLTAARRCLRSGGMAAVVIGDGDGIDTLVSTTAAAATAGLRLAASATIASSQPAGMRAEGNRRTEHIVLLQAP